MLALASGSGVLVSWPPVRCCRMNRPLAPPLLGSVIVPNQQSETAEHVTATRAGPLFGWALEAVSTADCRVQAWPSKCSARVPLADQPTAQQSDRLAQETASSCCRPPPMVGVGNSLHEVPSKCSMRVSSSWDTVPWLPTIQHSFAVGQAMSDGPGPIPLTCSRDTCHVCPS